MKADLLSIPIHGLLQFFADVLGQGVHELLDLLVLLLHTELRVGREHDQLQVGLLRLGTELNYGRLVHVLGRRFAFLHLRMEGGVLLLQDTILSI